MSKNVLCAYLAHPLFRTCALIEPLHRFDRLETAHFGYHGRTCFHTGYMGNRYFRIFRSNPHIVDGQVVDAREGLVDVQFLVGAATRDAVVQFVDEELRQCN